MGRLEKVIKTIEWTSIAMGVLSIVLSIEICIAYRTQYTRANEKYEEIQQEDSKLRSYMSSREMLIHKVTKGYELDGKELNTFVKLFESEYIIQIKDIENNQIDDIDESKTYTTVIKSVEDNKFKYVFKEIEASNTNE